MLVSCFRPRSSRERLIGVSPVTTRLHSALRNGAGPLVGPSMLERWNWSRSIQPALGEPRGSERSRMRKTDESQSSDALCSGFSPRRTSPFSRLLFHTLSLLTMAAYPTSLLLSYPGNNIWLIYMHSYQNVPAVFF